MQVTRLVLPSGAKRCSAGAMEQPRPVRSSGLSLNVKKILQVALVSLTRLAVLDVSHQASRRAASMRVLAVSSPSSRHLA